MTTPGAIEQAQAIQASAFEVLNTFRPVPSSIGVLSGVSTGSRVEAFRWWTPSYLKACIDEALASPAPTPETEATLAVLSPWLVEVEAHWVQLFTSFPGLAAELKSTAESFADNVIDAANGAGVRAALRSASGDVAPSGPLLGG